MNKKDLIAAQKKAQSILDQLDRSHKETEKRVEALQLEIDALIDGGDVERALSLTLDLDHEKAALRRIIESPLREQAHTALSDANHGLSALADKEADTKEKAELFDKLLHDLEDVWMEAASNLTLLEGLRSEFYKRKAKPVFTGREDPRLQYTHAATRALGTATIEVRFMDLPQTKGGVFDAIYNDFTGIDRDALKQAFINKK